MKIFYLVIKSIKYNRKTYLTLAIQLFVSFVLLNVSIAMIMSTNSMKGIVKNAGLYEAAYFLPDSRYYQEFSSSETEGTEKIKEVVSKLSDVESYGAIYDSEFAKMPHSKEFIRITFISESLANKISFPLEKGKWVNSKNGDGVIPIVIGSDLSKHYKIDDTFSLNINITSGRLIGVYPIKVKVVGIMESSSKMLNSSGYSLSNLLKEDNNAVIVPYDIKLFNKDILDCGTGIILYPNKNKNNAEIFGQWKKELSQFGSLTTFNSLIDKDFDETKSIRYIFLSIGTIILLLTIAGLGGNNALAIILQEREYAINFICGMRWSYSILITIIKDLLVILTPWIAAIISTFILNKLLFNDYLSLNTTQVCLSLFTSFIIYFITSIEPLFRLLAMSPISIIRRWE